MKTAPVLALFCLLATSWAQSDEQRKIWDKCLEQVGLTQDEVKTDPDATKQSTKCFYSCVVQNNGVLDDQGKINVEKIEEYAKMVTDDALRKELIDKTMKCKETVEASGTTDLCERGAALYVCSTKAFESLGKEKS
ncbi:general odorant-binding protein 28a [Anabrus simplex]|uniref:general odorant-binding protein 28a n=1 Tax=Anabrus simplex TaxID=316456 RepID=UPI0035A37287